MDADELYTRYQELAWEEGMSLETFLERATAGEYGQVSRREVDAFLRYLLGTMLENMETKAREHPALQGRRQEAARQLQDDFEQLFDKYT